MLMKWNIKFTIYRTEANVTWVISYSNIINFFSKIKFYIKQKFAFESVLKLSAKYIIVF